MAFFIFYWRNTLNKAKVILEKIKNVEVKLSHEEILTVMDVYGSLNSYDQSVMDAYFKRVPYSHPRWWHWTPGDTEVIGYEEKTPEQKKRAEEWQKRIRRQHEENKKKKLNESS